MAGRGAILTSWGARAMNEGPPPVAAWVTPLVTFTTTATPTRPRAPTATHFHSSPWGARTALLATVFRRGDAVSSGYAISAELTTAGESGELCGLGIREPRQAGSWLVELQRLMGVLAAEHVFVARIVVRAPLLAVGVRVGGHTRYPPSPWAYFASPG